ncbi:MAG: hypothetical protein ACQBVK_04385 [Candidatus Phytoplasma sp. TWB_XP]
MNIKLFNQKYKLVSFLFVISSIIILLLLLLILSLQKRHSTFRSSEKIQLTNNQNQKPNQQNFVKTPNFKKPKTQELQQEKEKPIKEKSPTPKTKLIPISISNPNPKSQTNHRRKRITTFLYSNSKWQKSIITL